tara:strand:- start:129 stop:509 length:381 start_codon:yes stop_codon:yes gene_type:complete
MNYLFKMREEFNEAFGIESRDTFGNVLPKDFNLEYNMAKEELDEYMEACKNNDKVEILDAIVDQLYLLVGKAHKHGVSPKLLKEAYEEVHRSNMSKLTNEGKVLKRDDGKIIKSANFTPPDLEKMI